MTLGNVELAAAEARVARVVEVVTLGALDAMAAVPALESERGALRQALSALQESAEDSRTLVLSLSNAGGLAEDIATGSDKPSALVKVLWLLRDVIAHLEDAVRSDAWNGCE